MEVINSCTCMRIIVHVVGHVSVYVSVCQLLKVTGTHLAHAVILSMNVIIGAPHYVILCLRGLGLA